MQKLSVSEEEQMSRKEYLKNKKKQEKRMHGMFGKFSKRKLIIAILVIVLLIYVVSQFYVYYKQNNYNYLSAEEVDSQKVYNIYYMSEGYTYNPSSSLNIIKSNSFDLQRIYTDLGFEQISFSNNRLFGVKDKILYFLDLGGSQVITKVYNDEVKKYVVYGNDAYIIKTNNTMVKVNLANGNDKIDFTKENVAEVLVDDKYVFLCVEEKNIKALYRYSIYGADEKKLTDKENVSYIVEDESNIYFVNKADENKIYKVGKEGGVSKLADNVKSVSDTGNISSIDGSKYMFCYNNELHYVNTEDGRCLWKINLETLVSEKVDYAAIDMLQTVDDTVFYKIEDQRGLYLKNITTGFSSEISSRLITEFVVEK